MSGTESGEGHVLGLLLLKMCAASFQYTQAKKKRKKEKKAGVIYIKSCINYFQICPLLLLHIIYLISVVSIFGHLVLAVTVRLEYSLHKTVTYADFSSYFVTKSLFVTFMNYYNVHCEICHYFVVHSTFMLKKIVK